VCLCGVSVYVSGVCGVCVCVVCVCVYIYIYPVMNTTILQLVAIYNIQLHVSALYVGLHTGPKHVVVYYIFLLTVLLLCSYCMYI